MDELQDLSGLERPDRSPVPDPLLTWALGAFHTAVFVLAAVSLAFEGGGLGNLLGGLNTPVGSGVYALLWLTTWWFTGWRCLHIDNLLVAANEQTDDQ